MVRKGGSFITETATPAEVFTPEDLDEEQRLLGRTVRDFVEREIHPHIEALEHLDLDLSATLMRKAGDMGLLAAEVPEAYGGLGLNKATSAVITAEMALSGSFTVTYGAHVGIGTLPIVYFGTEAQKQQYLPRLASGEWIAAYALTEPESGSDALGARTTARLSPDGTHYLLNGSKQWITNAGMADVFVVYAKVDGQQFTAFIVERGFPGVSIGPEEKKLGIKGSSTCSVILEDARVPVANVLGEVGRGHIIAFNILNIGRFKLGAGCIGSSRHALGVAAGYAGQRKQFGKALAEFRLIQEKLADMAIRTYLNESGVYRLAGLWDQAFAAIDPAAADAGQQVVRQIHEYAIEASIAKVYGSECFDFVVDETLQIHGGYGFMEEYPVSRWYRDSRINRIFEGTNEINRLLIPGEMLTRALKGRLPLLEALQSLPAEVAAWTAPVDDGSPLGVEGQLLAATKKMVLMAAGVGAQQYGTAAQEEQEYLARVADMAIEVFAVESGLLRAQKAQAQDPDSEATHQKLAMASAAASEGIVRVENWARSVVAAASTGEALAANVAGLRKLSRYTPANLVTTKRDIARRVLSAGGYV